MEIIMSIWFVIMIGIIFFVFWYDQRRRAQAETILQTWATNQHLTLIYKEHRNLKTGPFLMNRSKSQLVYRITVLDPQTQAQRHGWVKLGHWWWGLSQPEIKVIWDT